MRRELNLPIVAACTRGNTEHRIDLFLEDGRCYKYWPQTKDYDAELELDERWIYDPITGAATMQPKK